MPSATAIGEPSSTRNIGNQSCVPVDVRAAWAGSPADHSAELDSDLRPTTAPIRNPAARPLQGRSQRLVKSPRRERESQKLRQADLPRTELPSQARMDPRSAEIRHGPVELNFRPNRRKPVGSRNRSRPDTLAQSATPCSPGVRSPTSRASPSIDSSAHAVRMSRAARRSREVTVETDRFDPIPDQIRPRRVRRRPHRSSDQRGRYPVRRASTWRADVRLCLQGIVAPSATRRVEGLNRASQRRNISVMEVDDQELGTLPTCVHASAQGLASATD